MSENQPARPPSPRELMQKTLDELAKQRDLLRKQEASIPECMQVALQACEMNLMMTAQVMDAMVINKSLTEVLRDLVVDTERLNSAAARRLAALG